MKNIGTTTIAILASLAFAGSALAAGEYGQKDKSQSQSQSQSSQSGIGGTSGQQAQTGQQQQIRNVNDLQKFNVETASGEKLGKVDKVVVDLQQGQIGYVIVSAAQGSDKYIIPWKALRAEPQQQNLVVNLSPDMLKQAPKGDLQQVLDRQKGRQIHQFYGVAPYWEQSGQQSGTQQMQPGMMQDEMQERMQDRMQDRMHQPGTQPGTPSRPGSGM